MLPPLPPGWDFALRTRSVVAKCSIPRVAASGAALPLRCAWRPTRCIMQKIISVSSFGASLGNSANPKQSPPRLTSSLGLFTICSALGKPTTRVSFTAATKIQKLGQGLGLPRMTRPLIRTGRITRELHDEAGQLLTSLLVHLAHIHQDEHDDQHQAQPAGWHITPRPAVIPSRQRPE